MARRRRGGTAYTPPETLIEADFSKGIVSDADPAALSHGQSTDCSNFMLDKPGAVYKRGGYGHVGGTCGTACSAVELAEFPGLNTPEVLAWNNDLKLYRLVGAVWTATGAPTTFGANTGYLPVMHPVIVPDATIATTRGKMIWAVAAGNDLPRVYEGGGTAVRAIAGTGLAGAQGGRYLVGYKSRLALAASTTNEDRVWFSPDYATGVETAWNIAQSYVDADHKITGLAALQNILLIFSRSHLERLTGSSPPPGGDMSHGVIANVGCTDARSIALWNDHALWANPSGVYMSNGSGISDLTYEGGTKRAWGLQMASYTEQTDVLAAGVYKNFYFVSVGGAAGTVWVLDIPRRAWWQLAFPAKPVWLTNNQMLGETFYTVTSTNRVQNCASVFTPGAGYRTDADGSQIVSTLYSRYLNAGTVGVKVWRDARSNHKLVDSAGAATLNVGWGSQTTPSITLGSTPSTTGDTRQRVTVPLSVTDEGVRMLVTQGSACDLCELYGFEVDYRPLPLNRGGAT